MHFLPAAAHRRQPWKNGLGVSLVIADEPRDAGFDTLAWQVSATQIGADCPFSALPGLDRLFVVLEGEGVELCSTDERGATTTTCVRAGNPPQAFRGDWRTRCRLLGGPVKVLNVISRRGARVAGLQRDTGASPAAGEVVVLVDPATLDAWVTGEGGAEYPGRALWRATLRAA